MPVSGMDEASEPARGFVSAKLEGHPVRNLNVLLQKNGQCMVEGKIVSPSLISLVIHDASGKVYKVHKHHGRTSMTEGFERIWIGLTNGLLEVSVSDGKHLARHSNGRIEPGFNGLKPSSVELVILH